MSHSPWFDRLSRGSALALFLLGIVSVASLQAQDAAKKGHELEEVLVTGSRIRQDPLAQRLPVLTLSEEDIRATGATSIADFVQRLAVSGSAINATNNSSGNLGFPPDGGGIGAGAAEIDLRFLSSKRVLVLVDGRRWIKGSSGSGVSGAVDLNSIPTNSVKSIEILQDGASAVYGTDAIGGVVNIITQDDFDTLKASAYYGQYDEGDGETVEYDVRMGARGERSRALLDVSYTDQKDVNTTDRKESVYAIPGFPHGLSSASAAGRFIFTDPVLGTVSLAPNAGVTNPVFNSADPDNDDFHRFTLDDRFNWQPFNHLVTPNERLNLFAKAEYDVTDHVMFRVLASYNNRKSQGQAAPVPLFFGPDSGSTPFLVNLVWDADQQFNPFGMDLGPDNLVFAARRPIEAGPRIFNQDVNTWYVSTGFDGQFTVSDRELFWDVSAVWSENNATQTKFNQFNARSINIALGPPELCAITPGCVPLNIVGAGSMTREMLDFVTYTGVDTSGQQLFDATANLSGDLFELPAGSVGFAVGFEYREEDGDFIPDPVVAAGETADVPTNPTSGGFDVTEFYGEVIVPLLADVPGAQVLNVSGALRYTDYDLFSSDTVGKVALNWQPVSSLTLRGSYSEGFRAPNIGELFNLGARFDATISDRCSNVTPQDAANCAALGVPAGFSQLNPQIPVSTGGNRELQPETADTFTFGFSWNTPLDNVAGVDSFLVEVNYYDIEIDGAVQAPNAQDLLNSCIDTLEAIFCDPVTRTPNGTITSIDVQLENIGGIETSGIDVNLDLMTAETGIGQFRLHWMTTFLLDYDELTANAAGGFDRVKRKGTEVGSPTRGFVETKSNLYLDWFLSEFSARLGFRYLSSLDEKCQGSVADFELCEDFLSNGLDGNKIDSVFYTDAQVSWSPSLFKNDRWTFTAGVNNLFDQRPPACFSCSLNSLEGTLHAIGGQFWYLRAIVEM